MADIAIALNVLALMMWALYFRIRLVQRAMQKRLGEIREMADPERKIFALDMMPQSWQELMLVALDLTRWTKRQLCRMP